ncbi:MAG: hypothetical protein JNL97_12755 [Verrucomicrobiales bacterium]|nr:hypothetical protein [Verrucomicrobiales bacterium]
MHLQLPDRGIPVVGVHVWSSQARIRNVIVSGVFGNRAHEGPAKEGFGILINNGSGSRFDGGHLVEGCRVHMAFRDGENYSTGIFVGSVLQAGVTMYYSTVRSCSVGIDTGAVGHAAYAANAMTRILDSEAHHVVRAFFCDTGPVECVEIDGMRAHDIDWAVDMRVAIAGQHRRHFAVRNSRFFFRPRPQGMSQAMLLADETGNPATEICAVELSDCTFVAPSQREASKGRCRGKVDRIAERRCRWIGDWRDPVLQEGAVPWEVVA